MLLRNLSDEQSMDLLSAKQSIKFELICDFAFYIWDLLSGYKLQRCISIKQCVKHSGCSQ